MSNPFDYVSNGIWQEQSQGNGPQQSQAQGYPNTYYPNVATSASTNSEMSAYMPQDGIFNMPHNGPATGPQSPGNMQWSASIMTQNMTPNMMVTPRMSTMYHNTSFNMAPNGYGFYGGYGQHHVGQPCNAQHTDSSMPPSTEDSQLESDFVMERGVPYLFINGEPVSMKKKEKNEANEKTKGQ